MQTRTGRESSAAGSSPHASSNLRDAVAEAPLGGLGRYEKPFGGAPYFSTFGAGATGGTPACVTAWLNAFTSVSTILR